MCQTKSMIVLKNRIYNPYDHNHHSKMLEELNIKDDSLNPNFVRVEITPKDGDLFNHDKDNWFLNVDQDVLPDWFDKQEAEEACWNELQKWFADRFLTEGEHKMHSGIWHATDATVYAYGNTIVHACNNATVYAYGNTIVHACNSASVYARGNATVHAYNNVTVEAYSNATVYACDNTTVYAYGDATVHAYDNTAINELKDRAVVRDFRSEDFKLIVPEGITVEHFAT